jgi:hypothetical protein
MRREIEFPTEWTIPSVMEQDEADYNERPDSRTVDAEYTPGGEAADFTPETFRRGSYP